MLEWAVDSQSAETVKGAGHTNQVTSLQYNNQHVYSTGMDDTLRTISVNENRFLYVNFYEVLLIINYYY